MHTTAYHYHDSDNLLSFLTPQVDTSTEIAWVVVHDHLQLFAEHMGLLRRALGDETAHLSMRGQVQWFARQTTAQGNPVQAINPLLTETVA